MQPVSIVVEGANDEAVAIRLVSEAGLEPGPVHVTHGKGRLDSRLAGYNAAARHAPWMVVRDLDVDADCAPTLVRGLCPRPARGMLLCVAVRSVESWLLADAASMATFLGISAARLPREPDAELDSKHTLVELARRSRRRDIRADMVPEQGTSARVGPGYSGRIAEFASRIWEPAAARRRSESLDRCLTSLETLARRGTGRG